MNAESIQQSLSIAPYDDLVSYEIRMDNETISVVYQVVSITLQEGIHKIPSAQLVIIDGSASEENFEISDKDVFKPRKKIEILLGYHGNNETVFKGIIISNAHQVNNHCCELHIECRDEKIKMTVTRTGRTFENRTDADIVQQLLQENQSADAERTDKDDTEKSRIRHEQLVQWDVTDWDFMISRIDVNGYISLLRNGVMKVRKPDLTAPTVLSLTHGVNIMEFHADMDSRVQTTDSETYTWDYSNQKVRKTVSEDPKGIDQNKNPVEEGSRKTIKDVIGDISSVLQKPLKMIAAYMSEEAQQAISDSKKLKQVLSAIKGTVKFQGVSKELTGNFIQLNGFGSSFDGSAFVSAIQHEYNDGCWTTEATLGWDEKFFSENTNPQHPASAAGQVSAIQGLHTGIVTSIEDKTGEYRVKTRLPLVNENDEGVYARIATLDAGKGRGTFFRPELDDEVLIGFMNNDPRHPVILGMLHSSNKTSPLEPEAANNQKGYISRSGIKMLFDDEKKSFHIETPGNRVIDIDDEAGTITIQDANSNKLLMDENGISIETAKDLTLKAGKSISLSAPQISAKADTSISVEGSVSTTVKSGGITEVKGSIVKIN